LGRNNLSGGIEFHDDRLHFEQGEVRQWLLLGTLY
jgi:hypothetical protein